MSNAQLPQFRAAASRHRNGNSYARTWTTGQPIFITLNRQGYLNWMRGTLDLSVTVGTVDAGTDVVDTATLYNFLPLIAIKSPQGDYIHSYSLLNLLDFNNRLFPTINPYVPSGQTLAGVNNPFAVGILKSSATVQTIHVDFIIPIGLNLGLNFDTGMIMRQIANNDFVLQVNCANFTDLYGPNNTLSGTGGHFTITAISGTFNAEEIWYEAVNPNLVTPPSFNTIVKLRSQQYGPLVIGDNYIPYSLGPTLLDQMLRITTNLQGDTSVGANFPYIKFLANKQVEIENRRGQDVIYDNFFELQKRLPAGVFHMNFFDDRDVVNQTSARDFINTNLASQLDTVVNVANGTTLAGSSVQTMYRELVSLGA